MNENLPQVLDKSTEIEAILMKAVELGTPIETMERLLALRKELKAERARDAFFEAMAEFQRIKPRVPKRYQVLNSNGTLRYQYSKMEDITEVLDPLAGSCGLSYKFEMTFLQVEKTHYEIAACVVSHVAGHSERTEFKVPVEFSGGMNMIQAFGSASTYAKRYALCNAFGITPDDDDDAAITTRSYSEPVATKPTIQPPKPKAQPNGNAVQCDEILTGVIEAYKAADGNRPASIKIEDQWVGWFDHKLDDLILMFRSKKIEADVLIKHNTGKDGKTYKNVVGIEAHVAPAPEGELTGEQDTTAPF